MIHTIVTPLNVFYSKKPTCGIEYTSNACNYGNIYNKPEHAARNHAFDAYERNAHKKIGYI